MKIIRTVQKKEKSMNTKQFLGLRTWRRKICLTCGLPIATTVSTILPGGALSLFLPGLLGIQK